MLKMWLIHAGSQDWSDCIDAHADSSLHWMHISDGTFSRVATHVMPKIPVP